MKKIILILAMSYLASYGANSTLTGTVDKIKYHAHHASTGASWQGKFWVSFKDVVGGGGCPSTGTGDVAYVFEENDSGSILTMLLIAKRTATPIEITYQSWVHINGYCALRYIQFN